MQARQGKARQGQEQGHSTGRARAEHGQGRVRCAGSQVQQVTEAAVQQRQAGKREREKSSVQVGFQMYNYVLYRLHSHCFPYHLPTVCTVYHQMYNSPFPFPQYFVSTINYQQNYQLPTTTTITLSTSARLHSTIIRLHLNSQSLDLIPLYSPSSLVNLKQDYTISNIVTLSVSPVVSLVRSHG